MADFSPQARNSAYLVKAMLRLTRCWNALPMYGALTKTGQQEIEDISGCRKHVQWGLRLQEPIARAVGDRLNVRLKELDIEGTHVWCHLDA
jgi:hypothetical protein